MSTAYFTLAATCVTSLILLLLASRDPKRLRAVGSNSTRTTALSNSHRRSFALLALLPGAVLIALDQWPAFLLWLGSSTVIGWSLAQAFAPSGKKSN